MGIWLLLERISNEQVEEFSGESGEGTDIVVAIVFFLPICYVEAVKQFLDRPYKEIEDDGQTQEPNPDKYDTDKSWEPLHYLLTGRRYDDIPG